TPVGRWQRAVRQEHHRWDGLACPGDGCRRRSRVRRGLLILGFGDGSMRRVVILVALPALLGASPQLTPASSKPEGRVSAPVISRPCALEGVRGPADRTGIPGRLDHMAYDPAIRRLFVACVANGSLEVIDLDAGKRIGTIDKLPGPQGVAVAGGFVYVATGD